MYSTNEYDVSGTSPVNKNKLDKKNWLIDIENVGMLDSSIVFDSSPDRNILSSIQSSSGLEREFEAWDALSDEALTNFEALLD